MVHSPKTSLKNLLEMIINLTTPKWLAWRCMWYRTILVGLLNRHVQLENPVRNYYQIKTMLRATFKNW